MNKDQGESSATKPSGGSGKSRSQSRFDELAGKSQSAFGNIKDPLSDTADAAASVGDDLAKRGNKVADALQKGASTARDQVSNALSTAADNVSQSTAVAQDKLSSLEGDIATRVKDNPWVAVAIAALVGFLIAKI